MGNHLDRIVDLKRRKRESGVIDSDKLEDQDVGSLERISVYLELIDHAETRAQALAGMAGTALGVFFAAFIAPRGE